MAQEAPTARGNAAGMLPAVVVFSLMAAFLLNRAARRQQQLPFPSLVGVHLAEEDALQTSALAALGMRRLAADLAFIQLMIYYGTSEAGAPQEHEEGRGPHVHESSGAGRYAELGPRTLRIIGLDPYFTYAPLYCAGALAFNLNRPEEALSVLDAALKLNPREWKYHSYVAGIGFHKKGNPEEVIQLLTPVLADPDCPVMLKNLLAFLNRKMGRRREAVRLYRDILNTRDPSYYALARQALAELGVPTPE